MEHATSEVTDENWPSCWSVSQCLKFKKDNSWLIVLNQKLGCNACRTVGMLRNSQSQITVAAEWSECQIKPYGTSVHQQQMSLRKKIHQHKESKAHNSAVLLLEKQKQDSLRAS